VRLGVENILRPGTVPWRRIRQGNESETLFAKQLRFPRFEKNIPVMTETISDQHQIVNVLQPAQDANIEYLNI